MITLKKIENQFDRVLSRSEMKNVMGGIMPLEGRCVWLVTDSGMNSCWYSTDDAEALFNRVYPDQSGRAFDGVNCETHDCIMN